MAPVQVIAQFLVRLAAEDLEGEPMTPLRLHKLLYYCQGWYLAWFGKPLFYESLEAWRQGPVVREVWNLPWGNGRNPIEVRNEDDTIDSMSIDQKRAVRQVWSYYKQFSALGLRDMTHEEDPWKNHYHPDAEDRCSEEIPRADLLAFFGSELSRRTGEFPGDAESYKTDLKTGQTVTFEQLRKELGC
jgi:uncharacterized phage-associated protein